MLSMAGALCAGTSTRRCAMEGTQCPPSRKQMLCLYTTTGEETHCRCQKPVGMLGLYFASMCDTFLKGADDPLKLEPRCHKHLLCWGLISKMCVCSYMMWALADHHARDHWWLKQNYDPERRAGHYLLSSYRRALHTIVALCIVHKAR